jgi:hypothetical protein
MSAKIYVGSVVRAYVDLSAPRRFFPFSITGWSVATDSDLVFYVSNLSWNTTDESLNAVRLWHCLRYLILSSSIFNFVLNVM